MAIVINGTGTITGISATNGLADPQTGSILQVVQGLRTGGQTSSTTTGSWIDTLLSASITPKFSTSKILVFISSGIYFASGSSFPAVQLGIKRAISGGSTTTGINPTSVVYFDNRSSGTLFGQQNIPLSLNYVDSPSTASTITYTCQYYFTRVGGGSGAAGDIDSTFPGANNLNPSIILMEIAA